jgi:hypothetical protein
MSNVSAKWYIFHVYTLYLERHSRSALEFNVQSDPVTRAPDFQQWNGCLRPDGCGMPYEHEMMLVGKIQLPCFSPVFHLLRY